MLTAFGTVTVLNHLV